MSGPLNGKFPTRRSTSYPQITSIPCSDRLNPPTNVPARPAADEPHMNSGDGLDIAVGPLPDGGLVVLEALTYDRCAGEPPHRTLATMYVDRQIVPQSTRK